MPVIAVLVAAVLFGTTGTAQALGPDGTTPLGVGAARLIVGGTALALVAWVAAALRRRRAGHARRPALDARALALMAVATAGLTAYQPLFFLGTSLNGVAVGTVIALGSAPVLAGALEGVVTRRMPGATWMAATALAATGVVLLGIGGGGTVALDPLGVAGSVGAGGCFAAYAVGQRRLIDAGWHPLTLAGAVGGGSAILAIPLLAFAPMAWVIEPAGIAMALWLGLATIAAAYALFTVGLRGVRAATAATLTLAEPLTASLLAVMVLDERLAPLAIAGLGVLGAGLLLLAWGSHAPRDPKPFAVEA